MLRQSIHIVVEQQDCQVHVVPDCMDPVRRADRATVAVSRHHEDVQVRAPATDSASHRERPSMKAVKTVRAHVVRKTARTSNARHHDGALRLQLQVARQSLYRAQYRMIAAAWTPTSRRALVIVQ